MTLNASTCKRPTFSACIYIAFILMGLYTYFFYLLQELHLKRKNKIICYACFISFIQYKNK